MVVTPLYSGAVLLNAMRQNMQITEPSIESEIKVGHEDVYTGNAKIGLILTDEIEAVVDKNDNSWVVTQAGELEINNIESENEKFEELTEKDVKNHIRYDDNAWRIEKINHNTIEMYNPADASFKYDFNWNINTGNIGNDR